MASKTEPKTVAELFSVRQISPDTYVSIHNQRPMGNKQPIAFGGGTMGCAVTSAYASLPTTGTYHAYSIQGNFLGPTFIDRPLKCKVTKLRDTRTFATRQVLVYQEQDGNKGDRICLNLVADFQTQEPATVMKFSTTPTRDWGPPELAKTWYQRRAELLKDGKMTEAEVKFSEKMFSLAATFFDCRHAPNSFMGESMLGFVKDVKTDQDSLSLTERVSADWVRIPHKLGPESEHVAGLVAMMDMAMSFLPLAHSGKFLDTVGACSSLDFSFRLFVNDLNINEWKLREFKTLVGNEGRTFNEARLFDTDNKLVATMTQQSIMRPKPAEKGKI